MEQYKSYFIEEDDPTIEKRALIILKALRDEDFKNSNQRRRLIDLLSSLHAIDNRRSRLALKRIGELFSEIGDELIKIEFNKDENEED